MSMDPKWSTWSGRGHECAGLGLVQSKKMCFTLQIAWLSKLFGFTNLLRYLSAITSRVVLLQYLSLFLYDFEKHDVKKRQSFDIVISYGTPMTTWLSLDRPQNL